MRKQWLLAFLLAATPAAAHDWYDPECCSRRDCDVVTKIEMVPASKIVGLLGTLANANLPDVMMVTTKYGTVAVPPNFKRRMSKDGQMHACIRTFYGNYFGDLSQKHNPKVGNDVLLCIYLPPSM